MDDAPTEARRGGDAVPFTGRDLTRHTFVTWATFMIIVLVWSLVTAVDGIMDRGTMVIFLLTTVGVSALILCWIGAPLALLLERALRSVRPLVLHVIAFGALGGLACGVVVVALPWAGFVVGDDSSGASLIFVAISAACCAFGRYIAGLWRSADLRRATRAQGTPSIGQTPSLP